MTQSTFWCMALLIVVLWIVALYLAYMLQRVAKQRDHAWEQWQHHEVRRNYWQARALDIEREAQLAWHAYHAIGWGSSKCWNQNDLKAFKRLEETLDRYNQEGKAL